MMKTVVVRVDSLKLHPKYRKYYRVSEKYKAHDEKSEYKTGDVVMIQEMRPMSKDKRWRVVELVKRQVAEEAVESDEGSGINE